MKDLEVYIAVDESGYYEVGSSQDEALARYTEHISEDVGPLRLIKVVLRSAIPETASIEIVFPPEPPPVVSTVAWAGQDPTDPR